jgi:hypothetical protein
MNQTFTRRVTIPYVRSIVTTSGQYSPGKGVKPSAEPTQVNGATIPTTQMMMVIAVSAGLARHTLLHLIDLVAGRHGRSSKLCIEAR